MMNLTQFTAWEAQPCACGAKRSIGTFGTPWADTPLCRACLAAQIRISCERMWWIPA